MRNQKRWLAIMTAVLLAGQSLSPIVSAEVTDQTELSGELLSDTDDELREDQTETVYETELPIADEAWEDETDTELSGLSWSETEEIRLPDAETACDDENQEAQPVLTEDDITTEIPEIVLEEDTQTDAQAQVSTSKLHSVYEKTGEKLSRLADQYPPTVNSINGEWHIFGLARSNQAVSDGLYTTYYGTVVKTLQEKNGVLHDKKYTDYSRVVIALSSLGYDVTDVGGYNLLKPLADFDQTIWQGVNGAIFALLAFDAHMYEIPEAEAGKTQTTRERLIAHILEEQRSDGGWGLGGMTTDADLTGMALQALAPYCDTNPDVRTSVDTGVACLAKLQSADGGFGSWGTGTAESCAQVVTGLSALGIDADTDVRFIKNGHSALEALLSYAVSDGMFSHVKGGDTNQMATEQAFYAMTAYERFKNNENRLYDMTDVAVRSDEEKAAEVEKLIDALPDSVSLSDKESVRSAQALYRSLSKLQKSLIPKKKIKKLSSAVVRINQLEIRQVEKMISDIGTVTKAKEKQIIEVNMAYKALNARQQKQVKNYKTLEKAIDTLRGLQSNSDKNRPGSQENKKDDNANGQRNSGGSRTGSISGGSRSTGNTATRNVTGNGRTTGESTKKKVADSKKESKKDDAAVSFIEKLEALTQKQKDVDEYSEEAQKEIIDCYREYQKLNDGDKKSVQEREAYREFEKIQAALGRQNHEDRKSGVDFSENDDSQLPWYVCVTAEPVSITDSQQRIIDALGGEGTVYTLYDISFTDQLSESGWEPQEVLKVRMVLPLFENEENPLVVHIKEDGGLEFIEGTQAGSYIEFDAIEFSTYGVVGHKGTLDGLLNEDIVEGESRGISPWIFVAGGVAVALLLLVMILRIILAGKDPKKPGGMEGSL